LKQVPQREKKPFRYFINNQIRSDQVRLIDDDGQNLGLVPTREALKKAQSLNLDLVQIAYSNNDYPTCKIVDYSKFKFDLSKKEKEAKKRQRENSVKVKEVKFRPVTDDNDLAIKARQVSSWLDEGCRVKITITFRGRELSHQQIARETLKKFSEMIPGILFDGEPSLSGKYLSVMGFRK
jgi:translation initiation factor IF-3